MEKSNKLDAFEDKSILYNAAIEDKVINEINEAIGEKLGVTISGILLSKKANNYIDIIEDILTKYNYRIEDFYGDILVDIATIPNDYIKGYTNGPYIKDVKIEDYKITLVTKDKTYYAKMLAQTINNPRLLVFYKEKSLVGYCHELTERFTEEYKMTAETSLCEMGFGGFYLHSYNTDEKGLIYDVSHNLIMPYSQYIELFKPHFINRLTRNQLINSLEYHLEDSAEIIAVYAHALKRTRQIPEIIPKKDF